MTPKIAQRIVDAIPANAREVKVIWHGGEPLTAGIHHMRELLELFEEKRRGGAVLHSLQTNATLINDEWCRLFTEYSIHVGVSIDGPLWANNNRVNFSKQETFTRTMRGIDFLRKNRIPFTILCVVSEQTVGCAEELYNFFSEIGCSEVGFNIEEKIGVHQKSLCEGDSVTQFWQTLFAAWRKNPSIHVREFRRTLEWVQRSTTEREDTYNPQDFFPSIAHNGNVVLLSPEFLDASSEKYKNFVAGNLLVEPLNEILERASALQYVRDYDLGVIECYKTCEYSLFCMGGQASNKFFELGTTKATETSYCRNAEQRLLEAVLASL